ncbi:hypothetical protein ElyMa_001415200 [Elysia marginata]|uniref:Reverse transcriptase domain-containing protein n=1 Tax=Elysia marginata TaxID=1093978 RepID=A0AAV4IUH8_9GAST|nr:hypothetical protein ElyMa_001415200 [Elysia marginata]
MKGIRGQACTLATSVSGRRVPAETFKALIHSLSHLPRGREGGKEDIPKDFRDAPFVPLFNHDGSKVVRGSYRTVKCLEDFDLGYPNLLITSFAEESLPGTQCGFRLGQKTITIAFIVRKVKRNVSSKSWISIPPS